MAPSDSLPSLPAEIWDSAWNMVRAQEDLKSLSLTCWLFRSICQELLFNEVHFSSAPPSISLGTIPSENPTPESAESNSTYSRWEEHIKRHLHRLEGLSHHPVHRYSVKTVKFHGINNDHPFPQERVSELHRALISSYVLALEIFTNLRSVYLGPSIAINDDIVHALSSLANLDELQVHGPCSISIASPTIEVKMLTLSEPDAPHEDVVSGLDLCSDRRMTSLTVSDGIIHAETLLRHELAQARPEGNLLTHLVLTVKVTQLAMVFSFLERCRNLECITLSPVSDNGDIPTLPSLRTDSMPRLASYTGPFFLARMILPGRPVTDIKILCIDDFPTIGDMIYIVEMDINEDDILRTLLQISAP
ncbi:hypothetical protein CPC08DRAFT_429496 [Agrocybe pediades]|nr:hypothetical protein CPC08DRAFT_429496 [Agrocybe pediades]